MPITQSLAASAVDSLGCASSALHRDQELIGNGIRFYRKRTDEILGYVATPPTDRGFLVGVSMQPGHRRRILHEHHASSHDFDAQSVYVRNFADHYRADLKGPFDFVLMEISRGFFEQAVDEGAGPAARTLECVTGLKDPVLCALAAAMAPALEHPESASALFVDQMGLVIGTHLIQTYGGGAAAATKKRRGLSRLHEARAKEILRSRLDGNVSIADVADACNLSRSHFIRAFRESTGQTPHQWMLKHRVELALGHMLGSQMPLAEIAHACGFADQSHFTRVFTQAMGAPPGNWRRQVRN
ncbi:MAG: AraC family transcriptional regulator [Variovorax sp.]|nr:AraC family transcriptional regulator [Variovorax sp.]